MQIKLQSLAIDKLMKRGNFMLFSKRKQDSDSIRQKYQKCVEQYFKHNGFEIIQRMYNGSLNLGELTEQGARDTLVENYPIAPWIDKDNIIEQFVSLFECVGYSFSKNEQGSYAFKDKEIYSAIVKNHLKFSGCHILEALSNCCDKSNGKITYFQAQMILGLGYPKAPFVNKADTRACIILFLKETGIPFVFDDNYLYFP